MLSVVIPAHNEEDSIAGTLQALWECLDAEGIAHELLVVNDNSSDRTADALRTAMETIPSLRYFDNTPPHGFGFAVRRGLDLYRGDAVAIVMAEQIGSSSCVFLGSDK